MHKNLLSSNFSKNQIIQIIFIISIIVFTFQGTNFDNILEISHDGHGKMSLPSQTATNIVAIFGVSNKVIEKQIEAFGYGDASKFNNSMAEWICHSVAEDWPLDKNYLLIFPDDLNSTSDEINLNTNFIWWPWPGPGVLNYCKQRLLGAMNSSTWDDKFNSNFYEPKREFNLKLLKAVINSSLGLGFNNSTIKIKIKINIYTNFAERLLSRQLPEIERKNRDILERIELFPLSIPTANYYHFTLQNGYSLNFYDQYIVFEKYQKELNPNWHQIYVFGLSSNLDQNQFTKILNAARTSVDAYFFEEDPTKKKNRGPISVMYIGKFNLECDCQLFCNDGYLLSYRIEYCDRLLQKRKHELTFDKEYINDQILNITTRAIQFYDSKIYGARLPPLLIDDAIRPQLQPKPRIVLITDFVEKKFLDSNIINDYGFEFKVYALNNSTFEQFKKKADKVILMDPNNPGTIPFTWEEEEAQGPTMMPLKPAKEKALKLYLTLPIIFGVFVMFTLMIIFIIIYRRRLHRVKWLHRLEQFKTEHLYNTYLNEKRMSGKEKEKKADEWEIGGWDQINLGEQLGKGAFGEVRKAIFRKDKNSLSEMTVAVKMLPMHASEKERNNFKKEMEIMKLLGNSHNCIVKMFGCISNEGMALGIVMEYCPGGSLLDHLNKLKTNENANMEEKLLCRQFCQWAWQIADGMLFLVGKNLVHRDLAARNVLLDDNFIAKISDFGLCIFMNEKSMKEFEENNKEKLPFLSLAPECIERRKFSEKSDIWSFGLLLHEIYTFGQNPFLGIEFNKLLQFIHSFRPQRPEFCPPEIFEIMEQCLLLEMEKRPIFAEIKEKLTTMLAFQNVNYGYLELELME